MPECKWYMGIDPGMSGGIAVVSPIARCPLPEAWKMPDTERDICELLAEYASLIQLALIERVHAMPKQGVSSTFKFGTNYGLLRGFLIALSIPFEEVTPQRWQKHMGCLTRGDKNVSKAKAQQLFPGLKIGHATADALLIAEYGRRINSETAEVA